VQHWRDGLRDLRGICRDAGLTEAVKWGHPCYMHGACNIAIIGAFRRDFRLGFFNAALMTDPERVLERKGPNTRHPDTIRFTDAGQVARMGTTVLRYLKEAMGHAEAGTRPPKVNRDIQLPDELVTALDSDPELSEAFRNLTPGRQRSYVINLNAARKPETRRARIVRFRERILLGKGATER
jgi:uncharacterized protein YdeI (YjbR/CyaY-like superfamily)